MDCQSFSDEPTTKFARRLLASNSPLRCPAAALVFTRDWFGLGSRLESSYHQQRQL